MNRYMKCETITGEWWYKDLQTGEDLPKYATPIIGLEKEPEILTRWQDPTIEEYKKEIDKLNNIINELEKWIKENNLGKCRTENVVNTDELLNKLKALKENNK